MLTHVLDCLPEEACGLIGGKPGRGEVVYPIENELHSTSSYRMVPEQQLRAFLDMEQRNLECTGIYHSHPLGPDYPSEKDRREFAYPGTVTIIWYPQNGTYLNKGYLLDGGKVKRIRIYWMDT